MSPIDQTVPGGAYQSPDGSWHNANGKPIKAPKSAPSPQVDETEEILPPAPSLAEYEKPVEMVSEDDKPKTKRKSTKKA